MESLLSKSMLDIKSNIDNEINTKIKNIKL